MRVASIAAALMAVTSAFAQRVTTIDPDTGETVVASVTLVAGVPSIVNILSTITAPGAAALSSSSSSRTTTPLVPTTLTDTLALDTTTLKTTPTTPATKTTKTTAKGIQEAPDTATKGEPQSIITYNIGGGEQVWTNSFVNPAAATQTYAAGTVMSNDAYQASVKANGGAATATLAPQGASSGAETLRAPWSLAIGAIGVGLGALAI